VSDRQLKSVAVVNGGTSDPSTTGMLAGQIAESLSKLAQSSSTALELRSLELKPLAQDIMAALVTRHVSAELQQALDILRDADGLIVSTPVYKAGPSGLFSSFFQILDNDLLIGTPVVLAGTAGSARHGLVVDDQLRGLFAYMRTVTTPTGVFAAPEDWQDGELPRRAERAAGELLAFLQADLRSTIRGENWKGYQHSYGSAGGTELDIEFDSDLMRLATGG